MAKQNICGRPTPVLPTVYTETLSYGETLGKVITKVNECVDEVNENDKKVDDLTNLVGTFDNRITENTNNIAAEQAARKAEAERQAAELKAKADEARNKKEIAEAKQEAQETSSLSSVDRMLSGGFEANRGRLPMPITGSYRVISHFGQYNVQGLSGVTLDNKGINIQGKSGCMARSIYDGEVSAVFGYGGMWNVLVRHGAYISVYCNLKSVSVHKGQKISARQTLGAVGADNILQFQLRKETAKLNPESWLGS